MVDALERNLIGEFQSSNAAVQVQAQLRKFTDRLAQASRECGIDEVDHLFRTRSRVQAFEFLATVIGLPVPVVSGDAGSSEEDRLLGNLYSSTDPRSAALEQLMYDVSGPSLAVMPLFLVSLDAQRKYCIFESILVKVVTQAGDVCYRDMAGRTYLKLQQFLESSSFPFGILCYIEENQFSSVSIYQQELQCKVVGRRAVFLSVADLLVGALNVVSSFGLMIASNRWTTPIGLLTVTSSLFLAIRGTADFLHARQYGGLHATRSKVLNILMVSFNMATLAFVSFPYTMGVSRHWEGASKVLLGSCAGINLLWMLTQHSLHLRGWWMSNNGT